jgi:intracellular sulfur oxidation DsrE/DsrF family protein
LGESNVEIELVAYSIGVKMFFNSSAYAEIIYNLLEKDVTFAACSNT